MNNILLINLFLVSILSLYGLYSIIYDPKQNNEVNQKITTPEVSFKITNFDQDFLFLNNVINNTITIKGNLLIERYNYINTNQIINDKTFKSLTKELTSSILKQLSDDYLIFLENYTQDIVGYVYNQVFSEMVQKVLLSNSSNIKKMRK